MGFNPPPPPATLRSDRPTSPPPPPEKFLPGRFIALPPHFNIIPLRPAAIQCAHCGRRLRSPYSEGTDILEAERKLTE
jgi:hypothetical protein